MQKTIQQGFGILLYLPFCFIIIMVLLVDSLRGKIIPLWEIKAPNHAYWSGFGLTKESQSWDEWNDYE